MEKATYPHNFSRLEPFLPYSEQAAPIFMYHKVGPMPGRVKHRAIYLSKKWFTRQMRELHEAKFAVVALSEWKKFGEQRRQTVLTFDDGSRTVLEHGAAEMAKYGFRGIQYLVADQIGGYNEWDVKQGEVRDALMNESEVREWLAMGHEIGSHTVTHPRLAKISKDKAREEIFASKARLEDRFGVPIKHFCYPYGSWNKTVRDFVEEAGYETATTTDPGLAANVTDPFALPRIGARYPKRNVRTVLRAIADFVQGK